jgi:NAD(P)-dependent dehydrogenase (short-subunit alcohol dehydrogenase family)
VDFCNKRIFITGASRGLGLAHARYLASLGVNVVLHARQESEGLLQELVADIQRTGGCAQYICGDIRNSAEIVDGILQGEAVLDAIVHNAGSVNDASIAKMSERAWQDVIDVNLRSGFQLAQAVWPHFKGRNFGRLVFTSSSAGLYGNFGQANYSASKMGLIGLARTIAIEGAKYNIAANCIAPLATTEMNHGILPENIVDHVAANKISPLVAYLCHQDCRESGAVFEAAGGWVGKVHIACSEGVHFSDKELNPESIAQQWADVCGQSGMESPSSAVDSLRGILRKLALD